MVRMIVTKEHQYAGRRLYPGQSYDCEPQHVALFARLGWARPAEREPEEGRSLAYETRHMEAEPVRRKRGRPRKVAQ